jgi:hypothetical protein
MGITRGPSYFLVSSNLTISHIRKWRKVVVVVVGIETKAKENKKQSLSRSLKGIDWLAFTNVYIRQLSKTFLLLLLLLLLLNKEFKREAGLDDFFFPSKKISPSSGAFLLPILMAYRVGNENKEEPGAI